MWIRPRTCTYTVLQTICVLASIKICTSATFSQIMDALNSLLREVSIIGVKVE
jgi:hypothetical protein